MVAKNTNVDSKKDGLLVHSSRERNEAVDALRAVLIFSVLIFHYLVYWAPPFVDVDHYHYGRTYPQWLAVGRFGVQSFFAISGYVITMTLVNSKSCGDFLFKRFARLFPAFLACSLITFIALRLSGSELYSLSILDFLASLTVHSDILGLTFVDGSYWSLGVEVRFYLWVALFFFFLRQYFWIGLVGLGLLAIMQDLLSMHFTNLWLIGNNVCFFLIGVSFRYLETKNKFAAFSTFSVGVILYMMRMHNYAVFGDYLEASNLYIILMLSLLFIMTNTRAFDQVPLLFFPYLGQISYCMYLLHQTIGVIIIGGLNQLASLPNSVTFTVALLFCLGLASFVHHVVEKPAKRYLVSLNRYDKGLARRQKEI